MPHAASGRAGLPRLVASCFLPFAAGYFLSYLYRSVNAVIGPNLVADLGLDAAALGLLTSAYFLSFAAFQLPLGILLDRFGPRRVESALLICAATGAAVFAVAGDVGELTLGRALIGLGVSSCLMGGFKANVQFWPPSRLALANGFLLAFGGLGATVATLPVEYLLHMVSWRTLFLGLAAITVAVSALIWTAVPERTQSASGRLADQVKAIGTIMASARFWRVAPIMVASQASFLAYQGLWAGPWLRDVAGLDRDSIATVLFLLAFAIIVGYAFGGMLADRLLRAGIRHRALVIAFVAAYLAVQVPLAFNVAAGSDVLWVLFGLLGTGSILGYSFLTRQFPTEQAGRVNTALNLIVFVGAFAMQAGIGQVISLFPSQDGAFAPAGHQAAFTIVLCLQAAGWLWFLARSGRDDL